MDWYIKAFIRASLLWFALGILLGVAMAAIPTWVVYLPAHAHMNVVGFLTMLVFGVGYQLLPRLFGHPLRYPRLAVAHLYLANIGLAGIVLGFLMRPTMPWASWITVTGGSVFAVGVVFWVFNLWKTFDAADDRQRQRATTGRGGLPTVD